MFHATQSFIHKWDSFHPVKIIQLYVSVRSNVSARCNGTSCLETRPRDNLINGNSHQFHIQSSFDVPQ